MRSDRPDVRFLLDEHHPGWLADTISADGVDTVALTAHRPDLRGEDDRSGEHPVVWWLPEPAG